MHSHLIIIFFLVNLYHLDKSNKKFIILIKGTEENSDSLGATDRRLVLTHRAIRITALNLDVQGGFSYVFYAYCAYYAH